MMMVLYLALLLQAQAPKTPPKPLTLPPGLQWLVEKSTPTPSGVPELPAPVGAWYFSSGSSMSSGPYEIASVKSGFQSSRHEAYQEATLTLTRSRPGNYVLVSISRGQVDPHCRIRFDDGPIVSQVALKAVALNTEQSETCLIFTDYEGWLQELRNARRLRIEMSIDKEPPTTFSFSVHGLTW